jgi:hypothetical protein
MPEDRSLSELTTSEYLLWNSDTYRLTADTAVDSSGGSLRAGLNLSPKDDYLPGARVEVGAGPYERPSATLSVGAKLLNFESRLEDGDSQQGGYALTNTVSGKLGPASASYSETSQPGNLDFEQTKYGGELNLGPVQLYGQHNQSSQDVVDPSYAPYFQNTRFDQKTDTIGARGSLPVGQGMLSGDISRQLGAGRFPQHISQEARPTGQFPNVTSYSAGYEGRVGPGNLALQGNLTDVRGVGMEPSVGGSYTIPNPLGLGGQFRATGSYGNSLDPNQKTAAEAMMRYKLNF